MFAEKRVHRRTSGNPYSNKVVLETQRKIREKREYALLRLENEFLEIGILPELGGKIWYARDKKTGGGPILSKSRNQARAYRRARFGAVECGRTRSV